MKKYILIVTEQPEEETLFARITEMLKGDFNVIHAKNTTEVLGLLKMINPVLALMDRNALETKVGGGDFLMKAVTASRKFPVLVYTSQPQQVTYINAENDGQSNVCTSDNIGVVVRQLKKFILERSQVIKKSKRN